MTVTLTLRRRLGKVGSLPSGGGVGIGGNNPPRGPAQAMIPPWLQGQRMKVTRRRRSSGGLDARINAPASGRPVGVPGGLGLKPPRLFRSGGCAGAPAAVRVCASCPSPGGVCGLGWCAGVRAGVCAGVGLVCGLPGVEKHPCSTTRDGRTCSCRPDCAWPGGGRCQDHAEGAKSAAH